LNEYEKAIQSFERALTLDPTNDEIQTALNESRQFAI
jgi:cytochrome c-type biogenesis protein CcmH/NrfG